MKKKNILVINTQGFRKEGISGVVYDELCGLRDAFDISMINASICENDVVIKFKNLGINIIDLPDRRKHLIKYFFNLKSVIKNNRFDVVHIHGSSATLIIEAVAAYKKINKIIVHSHNSFSKHRIMNKILRFFLNRLPVVRIACSQEAGKWMYGNKKFEIINNCIDLHKFSFCDKMRISIRESLSIGDRIVIGCVANFNYQKNHEYLIKVFAEFYRRNENSVLLLLGKGENQNNIKHLVGRLGLSEKVLFLGTVPNVQDYLSACDVFLLTSRFEGMPLVILEAQASGLPVICSSNITRMCKCTEMVYFASINDSPFLWTNIISECLGYNREKMSNANQLQMKNKGFDKSDLTNVMINIYGGQEE